MIVVVVEYYSLLIHVIVVAPEFAPGRFRDAKRSFYQKRKFRLRKMAAAILSLFVFAISRLGAVLIFDLFMAFFDNLFTTMVPNAHFWLHADRQQNHINTCRVF